jgi:hypothetical protein
VDFGIAHNLLYAQALGLEYLGEDAIHLGDFAAGIEYGEREREIAVMLHSRERRGWAHYTLAQCSLYSGDTARAEREFVEGIALADAIGELRLASLLKGSFAVLQAEQASNYRAVFLSNRYDASERTTAGKDRADRQQMLDEALNIALENFQAGEKLGLHYSRFEAHRCLAEVRFHRGEFDEAERLCLAASEMLLATDSRVSRLWLGPLYIEVLLAAGSRAEAEGKPDEPAAKRALAAELLAQYQQLVTACQSPLFTSEARRLAESVARSSQPQSSDISR